MSADWAKLETHVVNGAFPLERCIGSTARSAVFLTHATRHAPSAIALKLVPFDPLTGESQLARWRAAAEVSHPHLLRLFEVGDCELDGERYLYARMELAGQTLADLQGRSISEQEAREVLAPTLDVLDTLHREGKVHGGLKLSNLLVVGDWLKLAGESVRVVGATRVDDVPATDIHALGVVLSELLKPVPESFREVVDRCLRKDPRERPSAAELLAWLDGGLLPEAVPRAAAAAATESSRAPADSSRARLVIRVELPSIEGPTRSAMPVSAKPRAFPWVVGAVVLLGLAWWGIRALRTDPRPAPVSAPATAPDAAPSAATRPAPSTPAPVADVPVIPPPVPTPSSTPAAAPPVPAVPRPPAALSQPTSAVVGEVMPTVSRSALGTIRGTVRVAVRVVLDNDGRVLSAVADDAGPSRYFEQRSLEAAKQWTFGPAANGARRTMRIRFEFRRSGVSASSAPVP